MKNQPRIARKLALRKETVRSLTELELGDVAGGSVTVSIACATRFCPTARICLTTPVP